MKNKTNPEYGTAKQAKEYLKFLKNPKFSYYLHFFQDLLYALKGLSSMFQSNSLLASKRPQKIYECCMVIDVLAVMPGDTMKRLKENLKIEDGIVSYKDIKLNKPVSRRVMDIDDTPDIYQDIYTTVFTNIICGVQEYICHQFKDFQPELLKSFVKVLTTSKGLHLFKDQTMQKSLTSKKFRIQHNFILNSGLLLKMDKTLQ